MCKCGIVIVLGRHKTVNFDFKAHHLCQWKCKYQISSMLYDYRLNIVIIFRISHILIMVVITLYLQIHYIYILHNLFVIYDILNLLCLKVKVLPQKNYILFIILCRKKLNCLFEIYISLFTEFTISLPYCALFMLYFSCINCAFIEIYFIYHKIYF